MEGIGGRGLVAIPPSGSRDGLAVMATALWRDDLSHREHQELDTLDTAHLPLQPPLDNRPSRHCLQSRVSRSTPVKHRTPTSPGELLQGSKAAHPADQPVGTYHHFAPPLVPGDRHLDHLLTAPENDSSLASASNRRWGMRVNLWRSKT